MTFADAVAAGLSSTPKSLPCRYFYDDEGSRLFDAICELPEYYLTRAERAILQARAAEVAAAFTSPVELVELGSGSADKTRLLIQALRAAAGLIRYAPIDISAGMLQGVATALTVEVPGLTVTPVAAEYEEGLRILDRDRHGPRLMLFLGSSLGNFDRPDATRFLASLQTLLRPSDRLLLGLDLRKEPAILHAAYNDAQGVTAQFNLNLLARINRELGGAFDIAGFEHQAIYDEVAGRIEMHLISRRGQSVPVAVLGRRFDFEAGERIHTENSYKYSLEETAGMAQAAGLRMLEHWTDAEGRFLLTLLANV